MCPDFRTRVRESLLLVKLDTRTESATVEAREGKTEQRNVRTCKNLIIQCPMKNSSEAVWVQLCSAWKHPRQRGNHTTERNSAEI